MDGTRDLAFDLRRPNRRYFWSGWRSPLAPRHPGMNEEPRARTQCECRGEYERGSSH
jgi:hypothetical protein